MNDQLFQMESRIKPSEQFIALSNEVLHELIHTTSGIEGVLLSSTAVSYTHLRAHET